MRSPDLARLDEVVAALRAECPWDRAQTLATLEPYLLEETWEVIDTMRADDAARHREELGDLLFQIVLQARIRSESGAFELADVIDGIADKLVYRHPHVFGDEVAADPAAVRRRWDELKRAEGKGGVARVPRHFPALLRAEKVGKEAAREGFDWPDVEGPLAKVHEELAELRGAMAEVGPARGERVAAELGDLLFAVVNAARHLGVSPELALAGATDRFAARYAHLGAALAADGRSPRDAGAAELDRLWEAAKAALASGAAGPPGDAAEHAGG